MLQIGEDVKIPESGVLLELLADLSSRSPDMPSLLPEDAVARAQQRYFIERFKELITPAFYALVYKQDAAAKEKLLNGLREVQTLMTKAPGKFFASDEQPQIADLAVIPHLARLLVLAREPDAAELMSPELAQAIASSDEFKPTREYADLMMARPSFKVRIPLKRGFFADCTLQATFDKEYILSKTRERIAAARASA